MSLNASHPPPELSRDELLARLKDLEEQLATEKSRNEEVQLELQATRDQHEEDYAKRLQLRKDKLKLQKEVAKLTTEKESWRNLYEEERKRTASLASEIDQDHDKGQPTPDAPSLPPVVQQPQNPWQPSQAFPTPLNSSQQQDVGDVPRTQPHIEYQAAPRMPQIPETSGDTTAPANNSQDWKPYTAKRKLHFNPFTGKSQYMIDFFDSPGLRVPFGWKPPADPTAADVKRSKPSSSDRPPGA